MKKANPVFIVCVLGIMLLTGRVHAADSAPGSADDYQIAKQILDSQASDGARTKTGDSLALMMTPLILRDNPGKEKEVAAIMQKTVVPVMAESFDDMQRKTAELYVQNFSHEELQELLKFQSSPLGQKYKKFNMDNLQKVKDMAKTESGGKAQEAVRQLVAQIKATGLRAPKELDH